MLRGNDSGLSRNAEDHIQTVAHTDLDPVGDNEQEATENSLRISRTEMVHFQKKHETIILVDRNR